MRKRFTLSRVGSFGNGKTLVRFTDPPELRGVTLLSINQPGVTDRQWIYTPATERVRSVAPRERSERFAGSDFTYEDIAEHSLDDFTYQLLPAEDIIENHKTSKVMATPVAPDRSQYKFIYYWVAQDVPCILHAEMYDQDGRKVREMHASGLRKESGMWGARKTEMRSLRRRHEIGFDDRSDSSEYRAGRRAVHPGGAGEERVAGQGGETGIVKRERSARISPELESSRELLGSCSARLQAGICVTPKLPA